MSLGLRGVRGPELGLQQQRTIGSSKCLWRFCFRVGQRLTPRLTYERWSSSASSGSVRIGYDNRSGELTVACRNRHTFQVQVQAWKVGEVSVKNTDASKLIKHVRDLIDRFWGVTCTERPRSNSNVGDNEEVESPVTENGSKDGRDSYPNSIERDAASQLSPDRVIGTADAYASWSVSQRILGD
ncbi:hypothetical protein PIB30_042614 [Stylosanthes scabra]|uniref:Uncharacterized protein n=1 Tax=Stylosanthes scabra TaxID=79078 RepID=A0ABU6XD35_9FABA|nr:hypothetical protein [Stylosanthes scabra]